MVIAILAATLAILIALGVFVALIAWKKKKEGEFIEPNYRAFFVMGIAWVPVGIVSMIVFFALDMPFIIGMPLLAMGIIYLTIGLANRDKWKKNR